MKIEEKTRSVENGPFVVSVLPSIVNAYRLGRGSTSGEDKEKAMRDEMVESEALGAEIVEAGAQVAAARAAGDIEGMSAEELVTDIRHTIACIAHCHARVIALIDEVDRRDLWAQWIGVTSLANWVMHVASVGAHTAREYVRVMQALREMPKVRAGLEEGGVSYSKVREVTRLAGCIPDEDALRLAQEATGSQVAVVVRNYRALGPDRRDGGLPAWLPEDGIVVRTTAPGRRRITIDLSEDEAAQLLSMLDSARQVLERQDGAEDATVRATATGGASAPDAVFTEADALRFGTPEGKAEEMRRRTEANEAAAEAEAVRISQVACLMEIVQAFPRATPAGGLAIDRARMLVHASAEVLSAGGVDTSVDPVEAAAVRASVPAGTPESDPEARSDQGSAVTDQTCRIDGFGGITRATAQRLACEALLDGVIKDGAGDVLVLGRSRRLVSKRQRMALSARDVGCQFPGCRARRRCDAHHIRPWSQGGPTDLDNLVLLCRAHHTAVHEHGLRIERTDAPFAGALAGGAAFVFLTPDGSELLPLGDGWRAVRAFDTARVIETTRTAKRAVAGADPGTRGGGYGFSLRDCIAWMFEAESRHAREAQNAA